MNEMKQKIYTLGEEIFNSVSHGVGTVLSIAAMALLIVFAAFFKGSAAAVVSAVIYGLTLVILYTMSTLYHSFRSPNIKGIFRIFDHCSIFLLIAGTYTPYTLVTLKDDGGIWIFTGIWAAALVGVILNAIDINKFRIISLICYIAMGWAIVFKFQTLKVLLHPKGLVLLVAGGIVYTVGAIFYLLKKFPYMHSVWHLFTLGGSILHFLSVLIYVYRF